MTYVNVVLAAGPRAFMERAARAGVAGVILPDLPIDEGDEIREQARRAGVCDGPAGRADARPTSAWPRSAARAEGFVYCVAVTGVTGGEVQVGEELRGFLTGRGRDGRAALAVGFGIRTPAHVAAIGAIADGVIVASELIRRIDAAPDPAAAADAVAGFCEEAVAALRAGSHQADGGTPAVAPVR